MSDVYVELKAAAPCDGPLKWWGGKSDLADDFIALMPRHLHYVEPFFGGGWVLFRRDPMDERLWWDKPTKGKYGKTFKGVSEVINDLNGDLMDFYAVLKDPVSFEALRVRLDQTRFDQNEWRAARTRVKLAAALDRMGDPVARAADLFALYRMSRSGDGKSFAGGGRNRTRNYRNDNVNAWWGAIDGLDAVHRRLKNVLVYSKPALDVIRAEDTGHTLLYCDPPYVHETRQATDIYHTEMSDDDHRELLHTLRQCKGKVMLSGYRCDLYDRVLTEAAGWKRHEFDRPSDGAGGETKGRKIDCLWVNY
jgi:DNA adenine methylase